MTPTNAAPTDKVTAAALGGAASLLILAALGALGVDVASLPVGAEGAIAVLVAFGAGYLRPEQNPTNNNKETA